MPKTEGGLTDQQRFYVYVIAVGGKVVYVGKGRGDRMLTHLRSSHNPTLRDTITHARKTGASVRARRIVSGLTEHEALRIERVLICRHHARLTNASLGGRSSAECALRELQEFEEQLKPEWVIQAEGDWGGLSGKYRLQMAFKIREWIFRLKMALEKEMGICHG